MDLAEVLQQVDRTYVRWRSRKLSYFAGCDYFRLSSHPRILAALQSGLREFGLNVAASRLTTGNHKIYGQLEASVARFFGVPSATLTSNGYVPNLIVAQALAGQFSHALLDERSHGSLSDAAQFLDCPRITFKHCDADDLARILRRLGSVKPIILTDGMFSHDGSIAPIREYLAVLPPDGMILLDDAHAGGVLGERGRGTPEIAGVSRRRIIQTITLSKAFGVYGGAVLANSKLRAEIINRSRMFTGNTPLLPPVACAALAAVRLLGANQGLRKRLERNTRRMKQRLIGAGMQVLDNPSPIIPLVPKTRQETSRLKRALLAADIYPPFIRYPGGPEAGYFRFVISSEHTPEQLENLAQVLLAHAARR